MQQTDLDKLKDSYPVSEDVERLNSHKGNPASRLIDDPQLVKRVRKAVGLLRELHLTIEHLPFRELSPNARHHWAVKARAIKAQRYEIGWLAQSAWGKRTPLKRARISYTFIVTDKRHRDIDNLVAACKSFQDGLVDAGVIFKDSSEYLTMGSSTLQQGKVEQTVIRIEGLTERE